MPGTVKWVIFIAYSVPSKAKLRTMKDQGLFMEIDEEVPFVAAILRV